MKLFYIIFAVLFLAFIAMAGDTFNYDVTINETFDEVRIVFAPSMASDSTGSHHSKPIFVGNINEVDAYITAISNATSDINVLFHVSKDRTTWVAITPAGLDACSTTAKHDTLGITDTNSPAFHSNWWLVIEHDGQAGNNDTDYLTTVIVFDKDVSISDGSGRNVNVAYTVERSGTNP